MKSLELYAALRLQPAVQEQLCAILDGFPPREFVCSMNTKARARGVQHGMTRWEWRPFLLL